MSSSQTDSSLTKTYLGVILVEVLIVVALWLFSRSY